MKNIVREKYESMHPDRVVTISNIISILRAFLTLPILYFLNKGRTDIALIFIIIAIATDGLDGWLARIGNEITDLGKILDPFADKVVIFSVMLYLLESDKMPMSYFLLLAGRDLTIAMVGIYLMNNLKIAPSANKLGKVSIVFTSATILAFIYTDVLGPWIVPIMWTSIFFLFISWLQYIVTFSQHILRRKKKAVSIDRPNHLQNGLRKTEASIATRIPLLGKYFRIDNELLSSIEDTLIASDLGVELTDVLIERLKKVDRREAANLAEILKTEMKSLIKPEILVEEAEIKPRIILFVGVNGTGKTTSIGKLAHMFQSQGKKVMVVAADTFRAAAYDQLKVWAERSGAEFLGNPKGKDPSAVTFDAVKSAVAKGHDIVMIDTAGRLHTKSNLMEELGKIKRVIAKQIPEAPHDIWLVLDANTGQNGIVQAQEFLKSVGVTGIILSKLDGTAKGGVVLAIHHKLSIPIRYLGVGEQIDDLVEFDPADFVDTLLKVME
ncbi:MAG: signal recognition particle-docking protein FtsY [Candidatus Marinimicrobia bacterium]|nr:signal recognition particle-docking protein FtsY [Candidatus Neomarinimicrobiota bacterium]